MRHNPGSPGALPSSPLGTSTRILHELIEALSALGLYLEVSERAIQENPQLMPDGLDQIIQKSLGQYERSLAAVRQLQDQLQREAVPTTQASSRELRRVGS